MTKPDIPGGRADTGRAVEPLEAPAADMYVCADCGGSFKKGRSDEECAAEAAALIPAEQFEESGPVTVCDDCFKGIMGRVQIEAPELLLADAPRVSGACYLTPRGHEVHVRPSCRCPR